MEPPPSIHRLSPKSPPFPIGTKPKPSSHQVPSESHPNRLPSLSPPSCHQIPPQFAGGGPCSTQSPHAAAPYAAGEEATIETKPQTTDPPSGAPSVDLLIPTSLPHILPPESPTPVSSPSRHDPPSGTPSPFPSPIPDLPEDMKAGYMEWLKLNPIEDSPVQEAVYKQSSVCTVSVGVRRPREEASPTSANNHRPPSLRELFKHFKKVVQEEEKEIENEKAAKQQEKEKEIEREKVAKLQEDAEVSFSDAETDDEGVGTALLHLGEFGQVDDE